MACICRYLDIKCAPSCSPFINCTIKTIPRCFYQWEMGFPVDWKPSWAQIQVYPSIWLSGCQIWRSRVDIRTGLIVFKTPYKGMTSLGRISTTRTREASQWVWHQLQKLPAGQRQEIAMPKFILRGHYEWITIIIIIYASHSSHLLQPRIWAVLHCSSTTMARKPKRWQKNGMDAI